MNKIIDLSHEIANVLGEPDEVIIQETSHKEGAKILGDKYGLDETNFPNNLAINTEKVSLTTHTGTHLDSPYHFGPMTKGVKAKKIKDIPLSWCWGKGKLIDLSDSDSTSAVTKSEIEDYIRDNSLIINPSDIILINTGADKLWNTEKYFTDFRGVTQEALKYLLQFGIKVIGIDSFGFDAPFHKMLDRYHKSNDKNELWPSHIWGRVQEYCHIERLTNLKELTKYSDYYVACFPIKMNTGASWVRVVAIIMEERI